MRRNTMYRNYRKCSTFYANLINVHAKIRRTLQNNEAESRAEKMGRFKDQALVVSLLGSQFVGVGVGDFPKLPGEEHHRRNNGHAQDRSDHQAHKQ